jgi:hypothetical protein
MGKRDVTAAGPLRGDSLRTESAPFPWEQFVDFRVGVIGYAADDGAKPSLGVDVVQASGLDKRVYDSGAAAAFIRAGEQVVFSSEGQRPHCAFGGVVGHFEAARHRRSASARSSAMLRSGRRRRDCSCR